MKAYIVFAHPGSSSFSHEILRRVKERLAHEDIPYQVHDLYQRGFQPIFSEADMHAVEQGRVSADVEEEQQLITEADLLVMIYPVYWWSQPAILKGWIDRVMTNRFAFRYEANGPVGMLQGKRAIVLSSTRESAEEMKASGMDEVLKKQIVDGVMGFVGFEPVIYRNLSAVPYRSGAKLDQLLGEVDRILDEILEPAYA